MAHDLHVVHLAGYGGPYGGSFIPMLEGARTAVEARGWTFEAVFSHGAGSYAWYGELQARGVQTETAPRMSTRSASVWLRRLLHERQGRVLLHTHFTYWDGPAVLAALPSRYRVSIVWHLHTRLHEDWRIRTRNSLRFGIAGRCVDRILCVGPEIRQKAVSRMAPSGRTEVFPNGIDLKRFYPPSEAERAVARERLGLLPASKVLLFFGWDWNTKGGPLLLDVLLELQRRGSGVTALVVGSHGEALAGAKRLGIDAVVREISPVEDVRSLYSAADVFVAPSYAEGFSFSLLEALSCGTPVIASDVSGHRYTARGLPGCRLAPRVAGSFANAIELELGAGAADRQERLDRSRLEIERRLSLDLWSARLVQVYAEVLSNVRKRSRLVLR